MISRPTSVQTFWSVFSASSCEEEVVLYETNWSKSAIKSEDVFTSGTDLVDRAVWQGKFDTNYQAFPLWLTAKLAVMLIAGM